MAQFVTIVIIVASMVAEPIKYLSSHLNTNNVEFSTNCGFKSSLQNASYLILRHKQQQQIVSFLNPYSELSTGKL